MLPTRAPQLNADASSKPPILCASLFFLPVNLAINNLEKEILISTSGTDHTVLPWVITEQYEATKFQAERSLASYFLPRGSQPMSQFLPD